MIDTKPIRAKGFKKFCMIYHVVWVILHLVAGIILTFLSCYYDGKNVATSIIVTIGTWVMGTLCFMILPAICVAFSLVTRFIPIAALPCFIILLIGDSFGDNNFREFGIGNTFLISIALSLFGLFNLFTAKTANKDNDHFNPYIIFND